VLAEGKLADLTPPSPVTEGAEIQIELVELDRHDASAAVGKIDGIDVCVGAAAQLVGKRVKVRVERVLDGTAYASLTRRAKVAEPLTAEGEAEKPTRKPPARKDAADDAVDVDEPEEVEEAEEADEIEEDEENEEDVEETGGDAVSGTPATPAKKKTRRGSRGGRGRKKPTTIHLPPDELGKPARATEEAVPVAAAADPVSDTDTEAGAETPEAASENGAEPKKKKTRRGSRGGKNRRKKPAGATVAAAAVSENGSEPEPESASEPEESAELEAAEPQTPGAEEDEEWGYVPMSEWGDEFRE